MVEDFVCFPKSIGRKRWKRWARWPLHVVWRTLQDQLHGMAFRTTITMTNKYNSERLISQDVSIFDFQV